MKIRTSTILIAVVTTLFCPDPAFADCASPIGVEGQVLYNADHKVFQFCDGTQWWGMKNSGMPTCPEGDTIVMSSSDWACSSYSGGGGGCTAPASCPNVGDACSDGSLFAGFMVYNNSTCEALYVTDNNQSTASQWKTATGTNDITDPADNNDAVDGQYNRDNRGAGTFPAFELCENNTYHGKNDWYLPASAELNLLWLNQAAIDANAAGNFTTSNYWSSTEVDTTDAWLQYFNGGGQGTNTKTATLDVRCVRRD